MGKGVFVTGIDTGIGKTVVSALLVKALQADYWKPVQSGDLDDTDTMKVMDWNKPLNFNEESWEHSLTTFHPERFRLTEPMSPHASAAIDKVEIKIDDFELPQTSNFMVVEGAGGLMVPLNDYDLILNLIKHLQLPVVLVSRNYLGSINHTLLSIEVLQRNHIPIAGLVFNGKPVPTTEEVIEKQLGQKALFRVQETEKVTRQWIHQEAMRLAKEINMLKYPVI